LAAHELFHAWNVKRLRDRTLGPFDYTKESYTRLLWLHEGFTDYLANIIILRARVTREKHVWKWLAEDWPKYASRPDATRRRSTSCRSRRGSSCTSPPRTT